MALKKPSELFGIKAETPKKSSIVVDEKFSSIKEEFNKVEELREKLNSVSSSLNNSLTEVVDKNLNFLSNEYSEQLEKFNKKINTFKEEINDKVDDLRESNRYLRTEIEIVEQRQSSINVNQIKEEVIDEVQNILSGDVVDNIQRLEEKIELVRESYQQTLNEGLLNEPPNVKNSDPLTPLDKKFVTLDEFQAHYKLFINRIQQQLATLGGGGAVRIQDLDDVDLSTAKVNNKFLKYNSTTNKWEGADASGGGSGITTANVSTSTLNVTGVTTHHQDVQFPGASYNILWDQATSKFKFDDSAQCVFGSASGGDMKLFHQSGNSTIRNETGQFRIAGNDIRIQTQNHSEDYITCTDGGDVKLFFNDSEKFKTDNHGAIVTGVLTATNFVGDGSGLTNVTGSGSGIIIKHDGSTIGTAGTINFSTNLDVSPIFAGIVTVTASGGGSGITTANIVTDSLVVAGVSTFSNTVKIGSNVALNLGSNKVVTGDGDSLDIETYGSNDLILKANAGGGTSGKIQLQGKGGEDSIILNPDADVKLFYNDTEKFKTDNHGAIVTGILTATTFSGSGASLTSLNASNLGSGTVPTARLGSGTANSTTYLRGDGSWQTVSSGALDTRGTTSATTGSIAQTASADITIATRGKSFSLLKLAIDAPAWVVLYVDSASRSSDSSRTEGTDPAPGSGVLTEVSTTTAGASTFLMSPAVLGWNNDGTPAAQIYAKVTNKRATSGSNTITVTLTTVGLEA